MYRLRPRLSDWLPAGCTFVGRNVWLKKSAPSSPYASLSCARHPPPQIDLPIKLCDSLEAAVAASGNEKVVLSPLALLSSIAFGTQVNFAGVELEGIGRILIEDIRAAADMGYRIKLLGVAQMTGRGLEQRMSPCLVPKKSPLGQLEGGTNMVVLEGDQVQQIVLRGPGAGEGPTASAVMGDVLDIARGFRCTTFGVPAAALTRATPAKTATPAPYYLRMAVDDKPGALAKVATALGNAGISIDRMRQTKHKDNTAPVLIVTHRTTRSALDEALEAMGRLDVMALQPVALRIESV